VYISIFNNNKDNIALRVLKYKNICSKMLSMLMLKRAKKNVFTFLCVTHYAPVCHPTLAFTSSGVLPIVLFQVAPDSDTVSSLN